MAPRILTHPVSRRQVCVGSRIRPQRYAPKLRASNYFTSALPDAPATGDYTPAAQTGIAKIYLNDVLGDCVVAGAAHMIDVWEANAHGGKPPLFDDWAIKNAYHNFSGGVYQSSVPTSDQGCDEQVALNFWVAKGFTPSYANPHRITAWLAIDATNPKQVRQALYLFGGLMSGVELPDKWIDPTPDSDGFVFDVAGEPIEDNGHCMSHFSWDAHSIGVSTWGMYGKITNAALSKYMRTSNGGGLYAAISPDALIHATGKAPNGFNAKQLLADATSIGFVQQ